MCGIWGVFGYQTDCTAQCAESFSKIRHRGPDAWRLQYDNRIKNACIGFTRLTIVDSVYGMQPMTLHELPHLSLVCNGELYNYKQLAEEYGFEYETRSDVECIPRLFHMLGAAGAAAELDGVFAFLLIDTEKRKLYAARDPFGVRPLFRLVSKRVLAFSSEAKGIMAIGKHLDGERDWYIEQFPPGHLAEYDIKKDGSTSLVRDIQYYKIGNMPTFTPSVPYTALSVGTVKENIIRLLTEAVRKRLMSERRIGCLLSGGLDSSLIAALLVKLVQEQRLNYKVQTFSIGMGDSPDVIAAREVAALIGSEHHEVRFTEEDVARVLDTVIYQMETADITTIRSSIAMYLISEYISKETDTTVIMSGEGSDEVAQGYIYFRDSPSAADAHKESLRLLDDIHLYDGLRADRTIAAHSLELRMPFLDLQFTNYYLNLDPESRRPHNGVEKHLLRSAFAGSGLIPDSILWRHKEAFSDGVASSKPLFKVIQDIIESKVTDQQLVEAKQKYTHLTPTTKEALYYRDVFERHFGGQAKKLVPYHWMPKWIQVEDPSARFIQHYAADKPK